MATYQMTFQEMIEKAGVSQDHKKIQKIIEDFGLAPAPIKSAMYKVQVTIPMELAEEMSLSFSDLVKRAVADGFACTIENSQSYINRETTHEWVICFEI